MWTLRRRVGDGCLVVWLARALQADVSHLDIELAFDLVKAKHRSLGSEFLDHDLSIDLNKKQTIIYQTMTLQQFTVFSNLSQKFLFIIITNI